MNVRPTKEQWMREWFIDAVAGFGLMVFIGSAFLVADAAPMVLHTF